MRIWPRRFCVVIQPRREWLQAPHVRALWLTLSLALAGGGVIVARAQGVAHSRVAGLVISIAGLLLAVWAGNRSRYQGLHGCAPGCFGAMAGAATLAAFALFELRLTRNSPFRSDQDYSLIPGGIIFGSVLGAIVAFIIVEARSTRARDQAANSKEPPPT